MSVTIRGGFPKVFRATIPITARHHLFEGVTNSIRIRALTNGVHVFFSEADATAGTGYVNVVVGDDEWLPAEIQQCWLQGVGGDSDVELIKFLRHG